MLSAVLALKPECNSAGRTVVDDYVPPQMPELAEVEWYRKQWNAALGKKIVDVRLHARNRVFRGTDPHELHRRLVDEKFLSSEARGKRMLFKFSSHNPEMIGARENIRSWLGIHLGMTGRIRVESGNFQPKKHDHLVLYQSEGALVFTDSRQFGRVRFSSWPRRTGLVEKGGAGDHFSGFQSTFCRSILGSTSQGADQGRSAFAEWFFGNRQLDGGRNFVAGKGSATEANRQINPEATRSDFSCDKICREKIT